MKTHQAGDLIRDAAQALAYLKEGNVRYLAGQLSPKDTYAQDRQVLQGGQKPFAVVLCCSDSRVAPEIFFDQKLGDLFVIRNAGNIADTTVLGSIEYAVEHLKTPLVVVCGHSKCGAVTAAVEGGVLPPNIQSIAEHIHPAVKTPGDVDDAIHNNVALVMAQVQGDEIVRHMKASVVGAYYDVHTGEVTWL